MQRLVEINKLLIAISRYNNSSKLRKYKSEEMYKKIFCLIEYVENVNLELTNNRLKGSTPYFNDNKILHTLLEMQVQVRLMQIGEYKDPFGLSTSVLSTYLLKMRTLARNAIRHPVTGTTINEKEKAYTKG
ncbi:hypothetical protein BEL55_004362 [Salmonella enterica subsp. enterica serovar Waycross]|nr:hypothetical protein [Salmonella enterica subsp. enterica serovar Waycross]